MGLRCALGVLFCLTPTLSGADDFSIKGEAESNQHFRLSFPSGTSWYYVIQTTPDLGSLWSWGSTGMVLGVEGTQEWRDTDALIDAPRRFYRVGYRDVLSPGDRDSDGMDDVWELRHGLNPLHAGDAGDDPDGDGFTNLEEYEAGADPHTFDPEPVLAITWPRDGGILP